MLNLGSRIKELRHEKNLTQRALAEKTHLSYGFISDIENGNRTPSLNTLNKITEALGVSVTDLLNTA